MWSQVRSGMCLCLCSFVVYLLPSVRVLGRACPVIIPQSALLLPLPGARLQAREEAEVQPSALKCSQPAPHFLVKMTAW